MPAVVASTIAPVLVPATEVAVPAPGTVPRFCQVWPASLEVYTTRPAVASGQTRTSPLLVVAASSAPAGWPSA
jgi:hypothetical protein